MNERSVFLTTLGCRLNEAELDQWRRQLTRAGHTVLLTPEGADAVVLNSCAVTSEAARKSRRLARQLRRQSPDAALVLTGCYATLQPEQAAALMGVDLVISNAEKDALVPALLDHLGASVAAAPSAVAFPKTHTRAFIKVQDGCRNRCTFCIVTVARGEERSRSIAELLDEIRALRLAHYQEIVLTGVHLGGYGSDLGATLRELIAAVLEHTDVPRLRLGSLEPWDLPADFFSLWADPRLCPHLHLPLQSGSDTVLRRMSRRCPTDRYRALIAEARATIPNFQVTTDLIVGFPGETAAEFQQTLAFLEEIDFSHVHAFTYSPRAGTAAARMRNPIPKATKRARGEVVRQVVARMKDRNLRRAVGRTAVVLWERSTQYRDDGRRIWSGYTPDYLRVETTTPPDVDLYNQFFPVHLTGVIDGERLTGILRDAAGTRQ